jgi:isocitrate dehydrogenase
VSYTTTADGRVRVTLIEGDGIGPEIASAVRRVLDAAGARIAWEPAVAGAKAFAAGVGSGVPEETLEAIRSTGVVLKGPLETPIGHGGKSANVTIRKLFEMFANVRPIRSIPGITTPFSDRAIDMVIVRENVEDLYAGIEHMQTPDVAQCLKLISRLGCEKIVRTAFALADAEGRDRVTCVTKANIMKLTEGMLLRVFEEVAPEYPHIRADQLLIDNTAYQMVRAPEAFGVIVTTNLNGDILSDLAAGLVGGLGIAPSANLGDGIAMFEAVHGSAPDIAGRDLANPTALLGSSIMLLRHIGQADVAARVEAAMLHTIGSGVKTGDLAGASGVGTTAYADAIIANLKDVPTAPPRGGKPFAMPVFTPDCGSSSPSTRRTIGFDLFIESREEPIAFGNALAEFAEGTPVRLKMISNRGTMVWPEYNPATDCVDHYRCRFVLRETEGAVDDATIVDIASRSGTRWRWMHIEKLDEIDGKAAYTRAQGES